MAIDSEGVVMIRPGGWRTYTCVFALINLMVWVMAVVLFVNRGTFDLLSLLVVLVSMAPLIAMARSSIIIEEDGLVVRGMFRKRLIWVDIRSFEVGEVLGLRQVTAVHVNGRRIGLPAPGERWPVRDRRFDENLDLLCRTARQKTGRQMSMTSELPQRVPFGSLHDRRVSGRLDRERGHDREA